MPAQPSDASVREAVGVFDTANELEAAIDELLSSGFDRAELSLVAGDETIQETLGHLFVKVRDEEDDPAVPRAAYVATEEIGDAEGGLISGLMYVGAVTAVGTIVAAGGPLAAVITGALIAGGAGGVIGAVLANWVGQHHADYLQDQLDRGGLLLWVRTWNQEDENRATKILSKHSAHDVHVHGIPAGDQTPAA